ncbi:hypothetical protein KCV07_g513, partial [Aureobasidium melanogenum]
MASGIPQTLSAVSSKAIPISQRSNLPLSCFGVSMYLRARSPWAGVSMDDLSPYLIRVVQHLAVLSAALRNLVSPCTATGGYLGFYEIQEILKQGAKPVHDTEAAVNYLVFDNDQWISFDDKVTFKQKSDWANTMGIGGSLIWASDLDNDKYSAHAALLGRTINPTSSLQDIDDLKQQAQHLSLTASIKGQTGEQCYKHTGRCMNLNDEQAMSDACGAGFTVVGWADEGCGKKNHYYGKPICCPSTGAPTSCQWRGGDTDGTKGDCSGECYKGEINVAGISSSWGGGFTNDAAHTATRLCSSFTATVRLSATRLIVVQTRLLSASAIGLETVAIAPTCILGMPLGSRQSSMLATATLILLMMTTTRRATTTTTTTTTTMTTTVTKMMVTITSSASGRLTSGSSERDDDSSWLNGDEAATITVAITNCDLSCKYHSREHIWRPAIQDSPSVWIPKIAVESRHEASKVNHHPANIFFYIAFERRIFFVFVIGKITFIIVKSIAGHRFLPSTCNLFVRSLLSVECFATPLMKILSNCRSTSAVKLALVFDHSQLKASPIFVAVVGATIHHKPPESMAVCLEGALDLICGIRLVSKGIGCGGGVVRPRPEKLEQGTQFRRADEKAVRDGRIGNEQGLYVDGLMKQPGSKFLVNTYERLKGNNGAVKRCGLRSDKECSVEPEAIADANDSGRRSVVEDEDTDDELLKVAFVPEETKGRSTTVNLLESDEHALDNCDAGHTEMELGKVCLVLKISWQRSGTRQQTVSKRVAEDICFKPVQMLIRGNLWFSDSGEDTAMSLIAGQTCDNEMQRARWIDDLSYMRRNRFLQRSDLIQGKERCHFNWQGKGLETKSLVSLILDQSLLLQPYFDVISNRLKDSSPPVIVRVSLNLLTTGSTITGPRRSNSMNLVDLLQAEVWVVHITMNGLDTTNPT